MTSLEAMNSSNHCIRMSESDESGGRGDADPAGPTDLESASVYSQESMRRRALPSTIKHRMSCGAEHCQCHTVLNQGSPKVPPVPDFDSVSGRYCCDGLQYKSEYDSESAVDDAPPSIPPVPDFDEDDDGEGEVCDCPMCCSREDTRLYTPTGSVSLGNLFNENLMNTLCKYFTCPICHDPMAEATAANCGHAFCSNCLETWLKKKPICPVCCLEVTCCIRLFNVDHVIEDAARELMQHQTNDDEMIADLSKRISLAAAERDRKEKATPKVTRMLKRLKQKMNEIRTLHQCKGFTGVLQSVNHSRVVLGIKESIGRRIPSRQNVSCGTSEPPVNGPIQQLSPHEDMQATRQQSKLSVRCMQIGLVATGVFLGQALLNLNSCKQFFWYIWLCLTKYDGHIPDHLLNNENALQIHEPSSSGGWKFWK